MAAGAAREWMGRAAWIAARARFLVQSGGVPRVARQLVDRAAAMVLPPGPPPAVDRRPGPHVLVIDKYVPTPDRDTGSLRLSLMMRLLADAGAAVTFAPMVGGGEERHRALLAGSGIEVLTHRGGRDAWLASNGSQLRLAILVRRPIARAALPRVRKAAPSAKVAYETIDLESVREARRAEVDGNRNAAAFAQRLRHEEVQLVRDCDATIVTTPEEEAILRGAVPDALFAVVPAIHVMPEPPFPGVDARCGLLFVGNFRHGPNVDAVRYLADVLLPRVRTAVGPVTLTVVGGNPPRWMEQLDDPDIEVTGWVPDLRPFYDRARVAVVPLRFGAGMKGKVTEAMAHGVPVVTTAVGAEGVDAHRGDELMVADGDEAMASALTTLLTDDDEWRRLATNGRAVVAERYSPAAVGPRLTGLLDALGIAT
ncbi:MAG TPA: glycosyltransferase family 4 protein [Acidimicrobiales bacterium]|nr:glycosyltransferase family 4 protein [Acidimicrobiales bacterium]